MLWKSCGLLILVGLLLVWQGLRAEDAGGDPNSPVGTGCALTNTCRYSLFDLQADDAHGLITPTGVCAALAMVRAAPWPFDWPYPEDAWVMQQFLTAKGWSCP